MQLQPADQNASEGSYVLAGNTKKYKQICTILGKSAKISFLSQSKNYIVSMKSVLTRMIVMKIQYFFGHTGICPEPIRHQNLYISYKDTFMKKAKLCTMFLNLNAQKSLESRNQYLNLVYDTKY